MNAPALELMLRVAGERLASQPCPGCGTALDGSPVRLREQADDHAVVEVVCRSCGRPARIEIRPEADEGVAQVR